MKYDIKYSPAYSLLDVSLDSNEIIVAEAGAMVYMSPQINVKTRKREEKGLWKTIKTTILGAESFFVNEYVAEKGSGKVGFVPAPVGDIRPFEVKGGKGLILQKSSYVAPTNVWYSLALDSNNNPHISYANERELFYANWSGHNWNIETVDSSGNGFWYVSLVLDNLDNPHIIYYDYTGQVGYGTGDTRYARWNGSAWNIQIAFPEISSVKSFALDSNGYPHLSYSKNLNLTYVSWDGSRWNTQNLGAITFVGGHIALDSEDNPNILYSNDEILGFARWNGSNWIYQIIDTSPLYDEGLLVLDSFDNPHVCYFVAPYWRYGDLTYATLTDGGTKPDEPEIPTEAPWVAANFFPEPNSVDVPLDTNLRITFGRPPSIVELTISPEISISQKTIDSWGLYGALYTFNFSELLEPSTTYNVTIVYGTPNSTRTWTFTTSNEIPKPSSTDKDDQYDLTPIYLIIIIIVVILSVLSGLYLSKLKRKTKKD